MPVRPLPPNPNLDHLKYQAKDLLRDHARAIQPRPSGFGNFIRASLVPTDAEIFDVPPPPQRRSTRYCARIRISELGPAEAAH